MLRLLALLLKSVLTKYIVTS